MLLAVDAGNTTVKFAVFEDEKVVSLCRTPSSAVSSAAGCAAIVQSAWASDGVDFTRIRGAVVSSVVPSLTPLLAAFAQQVSGAPPVIVGPGLDLGLEIRYTPPGAVGADRLADAVAAAAGYGAPCIAVDFGTATTFSAIGAPEYPGGLPIFLGGAIVPGIGISVEALVLRAARLSSVPLGRPPRAIADNTVHGLQSGVLFGFVGLVDGLAARFRAEMNAPQCPVVATGGCAAPLIAQESSAITHLDPLLTLIGLRLIYERSACGEQIREG